VYQAQDLSRLGVALGRLLGENAPPVDLDFKDAARGLDQPYFGLWKCAADLGRQTGGPRFVISNDAVFDRDGHVVNDSRA
jgi:hypothetical protein